MQPALFNLSRDDAATGFRLERFELFNWGTFHGRPWSIEPAGSNALVTGDIGSGKSTLVDAITTLLVPQHKITYNKAAGAESRERSLGSYIRGEYKKELDEERQQTRAVPLRDENSYSVLLAQFRNARLDQVVTLAQVLWLKGGATPERFFVVAPRALSFQEHFFGFGRDLRDLKRGLKNLPGAVVTDAFQDYSRAFRRSLGIERPEAMELFYQTISMKTVGNLNEFVRAHMLEHTDAQPRIDALCRNFENLNRAHEAVQKAKDQIALLVPLVDDGRRYADEQSASQELRRSRDALAAYCAGIKVGLLDERIEQDSREAARLEQKLQSAIDEIEHLRNEERRLADEIARAGGDRIRGLAQEIADLSKRRDEAREKRGEYTLQAGLFGLGDARTEEEFCENAVRARDLAEALERQSGEAEERATGCAIEASEARKELAALDHEIHSLRSRRSSIPTVNLSIRSMISETLGVPECEIPFAGELIEVMPDESKWEGAIERVLRNFGLSLLISEALYPRVNEIVEKTRLGGRLVYFRTSPEPLRITFDQLNGESLARKLAIRSDTPFQTWIETRLVNQYDYVCCESLVDFRRQTYAITLNGQIKSAGNRHEKDDRRDIRDRAQFVLGWDNSGKLRAIEAARGELAERLERFETRRSQLVARQRQLRTRRDDALKWRNIFRSFAEINWQAIEVRVEALRAELARIEEGSVLVKTLLARQAEIATGQKRMSEVKDDLLSRLGGVKRDLERHAEERLAAIEVREAPAEQERDRTFELIQSAQEEVLPSWKPNLKSLLTDEKMLRETLQGRIDACDQRIKRLSEKIVRAMDQFKTKYPAETKDFDASIESLAEFRDLRESLEREDLPRHEMKFRELLKEGTIQGIAMFQNQLEKERQEIEEKIALINESLRDIEYNPGTFIRLVADATVDLDVRNFRQELRQCLSRGLEDDAYNEEKFLQVKALIARFRGKPDESQTDFAWTAKVTDVRNWFQFSASERWAEDGTEKEFYAGSAGKSGGQKEKLAYTVLASALAYQYGIERDAGRGGGRPARNSSSRAFRFVVIDEAFGRGSDESTRYALELFRRLDLQLLVVTPKTKLNIIEDYVKAIHFIHNDDGRNSVIRNITVEEYREEKARQEAAPLEERPASATPHVGPAQAAV